MQGGEGTVGQLDVIALRGISAQAVHGVLEKEWNAPQSFTVDLILWVDTDPAALSDDIADTVSYAEIAEKTHAILSGPSVRLIETLGHKIADVAMEDERVRGVEVIVHKPDAPIEVPFADVSVTIRKGDIPLSYVAASNTLPFNGPASPQEVIEPSAPVKPTAGAEEQLETPPVEIDEDRQPEVKTQRSHRGSYAEDDRPQTRNIVLAFGGNIGNVPVTIKNAIDTISAWEDVEITKVSPLVRTRAVLRPGQDAQPDYWNAVVLGSISCDPMDFLDRLHKIEASLGRVRHEVWGERTIDIDIIDVEGLTSQDPRLTLPHPRAYERAFVLSPWLMADEDAELSGHGPLAELIAQAPDRSGILDAVADWLDESESVMSDSDKLLDDMRLPRVDHAQELRPLKLETNGIPLRPSRLDMLPEMSRSDLAPNDEGTDFVWKQLWNRWGSPVEAVESRHVELSKPSAPPVVSTPTPVEEESAPSDTNSVGSHGVPVQLASRQVPAPAPLKVPSLKLPRLSGQGNGEASAQLTEGMVSLAPSRPMPSVVIEQPTVVRRSLSERVQSRETEIPPVPSEEPTVAPEVVDTAQTPLPSASPITAEVPVGRRSRRPRWRPVTQEGTGISTADSPRPFRARTDRLAAQSHRAKPSHRAPQNVSAQPASSAPQAAEEQQPKRSSLFERRPENSSAKKTSYTSAQSQGQAAEPTQSASPRRSPSTRALPGWNFSEDVRVVDDSSALSPREDTTSSQPSLPPRYSHVLDPKLADTIDQGRATETGPQNPSSNVRRNVTIRPSVTGQIPVFRRRSEDS